MRPVWKRHNYRHRSLSRRLYSTFRYRFLIFSLLVQSGLSIIFRGLFAERRAKFNEERHEVHFFRQVSKDNWNTKNSLRLRVRRYLSNPTNLEFIYEFPRNPWIELTIFDIRFYKSPVSRSPKNLFRPSLNSYQVLSIKNYLRRIEFCNNFQFTLVPTP